MYRGPERRTFRRIPMRAAVSLQVAGQSRGGRALDLSEGGLFLHTAAPVVVGSEVELRITLGSGQEVRAVAHVLRRDDTRDGFGLRFIELRPAALATIRGFVASAAAA